MIKTYAKYSFGGTRLWKRRWNKHERVLHFYCWPKIWKYKIYNKIRKGNLVQVLSKEVWVEGSKRRTFFRCKTLVKEKNGIAYKPSTLTYFQQSVQRHLNTKGSTVNLQIKDCFKLLKFLERFYNTDQSITGRTWWR